MLLCLDLALSVQRCWSTTHATQLLDHVGMEQQTSCVQMTLFLDAASPKHRQAILDALSSDDESGSDEASCSDEDDDDEGEEDE